NPSLTSPSVQENYAGPSKLEKIRHLQSRTGKSPSAARISASCLPARLSRRSRGSGAKSHTPAALLCAAVKATNLDLDSRSHGRAQRHLLEKGPFGPGWLGPDHRVDERLHILENLLLGERGLAHAGMNQSRLLRAKFDLAPLGRLDRAGDVHGDRAELWIRHQPARA